MTTSKKSSKTTLAYVGPKADLRHDRKVRDIRGFVQIGTGCYKADMPTLDEQRA
jgi:hypothetical protein